MSDAAVLGTIEMVVSRRRMSGGLVSIQPEHSFSLPNIRPPGGLPGTT